ncbi:hypothetical protein CC1G_14337 [Coprinopsis cinerea okayama7|uniref:Uncharacterized protein n=1 Tax=Coprinopsis cinerea (strain Okayama-7 / 130 / ATCC MYA-4618 / FGSC 9003) TaxID=240176 RepID=D6RM70_COPC7|nr:hypothetical protein CC1G_14337 [Coprinopsis cinerea okayama7\|eukprot:XP_002911339.1 hypothetical protein CC1G_14337 [Coprinopsis cinerea okayama7\
MSPSRGVWQRYVERTEPMNVTLSTSITTLARNSYNLRLPIYLESTSTQTRTQPIDVHAPSPTSTNHPAHDALKAKTQQTNANDEKPQRFIRNKKPIIIYKKKEHID